MLSDMDVSEERQARDGHGIVLVVEPDAVARERMGSWLEAAGFDVMICPGPGEPDYTCIGSTGAACPLADAAQAVVLDLWLPGDTLMTGTPGWELLLYYSERGKAVVALSGEDDPVRPTPEPNVTVLNRPAERDELIAAVLEVTRTLGG
jgi:CheY-like chemotaxis protein